MLDSKPRNGIDDELEEEVFAQEALPRARVVPAALKPMLPVGRALRDWWRDLFVLSVAVIAWAALSITIIGGPPAGAALFSMARASVLHENPDLRLFGSSLRAYFVRSWALALVGLLGVLILAADLQFYPSILAGSGIYGIVVGAVLLYVGLVWFQTLFYAWPLMVAREDFTVKQLLRNGFLLALRYPLNNIVAALFVALLFVIAFYLPPVAVLIIPILVPLLALHNLYLLAPELAPDDSAAYEVVS